MPRQFVTDRTDLWVGGQYEFRGIGLVEAQQWLVDNPSWINEIHDKRALHHFMNLVARDLNMQHAPVPNGLSPLEINDEVLVIAQNPHIVPDAKHIPGESSFMLAGWTYGILRRTA